MFFLYASDLKLIWTEIPKSNKQFKKLKIILLIFICDLITIFGFNQRYKLKILEII